MVDQVHVSSPSSSGLPHLNTEVRLVTVERDMAGVKQDIGEIKTSQATGFKELGMKMDAKGSTNWTVVGLVLGAVFTLAGWGFALFGSFQNRTADEITGLKALIAAGATDTKSTIAAIQADTKATIAAIQADSKSSFAQLAIAQKAGDDALASEFKLSGEKYISRPDILDKFQTAKEKRDSQQATTDGRIERVEKDLADAKKEIVPVGTHREQWDHQRYINERTQKEIDDIRQKNDELFNGRDAIQRILQRVDKLDAEIRQGEHK